MLFFILMSLLVCLFSRRKYLNSKAEVSITEKDIVDCLKSGNKIVAIQHFRDLHNVSLTEAKAAIEKMLKDMR